MFARMILPCLMSLAATLLALSPWAMVSAQADPKKPSSVLDFQMKDIDGKDVDLSRYQGKVLLIVNTASQCGLTPQYKGLQAIYEKYKDQGFEVLAFPANEFGKQEPGTNNQIKEFCTTNYKVSFPALLEDRGQGQGHPPALRVPDQRRDRPQVRRRDRLELRQVPGQSQGRSHRPIRAQAVARIT